MVLMSTGLSARFIQQVRRDGAYNSNDRTVVGDDLQALSKHGLAPPTAKRLETDHPRFGYAGYHEPDFIHVTGHHDFWTFIVTAKNGEQTAQPILHELICIWRKGILQPGTKLLSKPGAPEFSQSTK